MKIEKAQISNAEILTDLSIQSKSKWGYSQEQIESWIPELTITKNYIKTNWVFKGMQNGEIVGFYTLIKIEAETMELDFFFISSKFMSKGFGELLIKDCLNRCKKSGIRKLQIISDPNAQGFYERFGFRKVGEKESSIQGRFLGVLEQNI